VAGDLQEPLRPLQSGEDSLHTLQLDVIFHELVRDEVSVSFPTKDTKMCIKGRVPILVHWVNFKE
jgi:hypothetical protein